MKTLVKSWQQLLQARPSVTNGLPPTPQRTSTPTNPSRASSPLALYTTASPTLASPAKKEEPTYSPVKPHDASKLTITSSSPQTVRELFSEGEKVTNGALAQGVASDPAKNRRKLLKLLSKVKKPTPQPAASAGPTNISHVTPTTSATTAEPSSSNQPINTFTNNNFISIDDENGSSTSNGRDVSLKPTPPPVENEDCSSLRVCLPRGTIPRTPQTSRKTVHKRHKRLKQDVLDSLSVSLPRNLIRLKSQQIPPITSADSLNMETTTFVVNIPIKYYAKKNHYSSGKKMRDTVAALEPPTVPVRSISPANPSRKTLEVILPTVPVRSISPTNSLRKTLEVIPPTVPVRSISPTNSSRKTLEVILPTVPVRSISPANSSQKTLEVILPTVPVRSISSANSSQKTLEVIPPTVPVRSISPANSSRKTLEVIEQPQILRMPHKTLNSDTQESEPMEVDDVPQTTTEAALDNTTVNNQTSHEDKEPSIELSKYCYTEPVSSSELTSVMLLPYVYIDGITDESF